MSLDQIVEFSWRVANFLLTIAGAGSVMALLYGGFLYLISAGDSLRVTKAHQTMIWSLVGIIIIFSAKTIIRIECNVLNVPDCNSEQLTVTTTLPNPNPPPTPIPTPTPTPVPIPTPPQSPPTIPFSSTGLIFPPDELPNDVAINIQPITGGELVNITDGSENRTTTFIADESGSGIGIIRAKYPNVFIVGGDIPTFDALALRQALDDAFASLPPAYQNLPDSYILVPTTVNMHCQMTRASGITAQGCTEGRSFIEESGNTMLLGGLASGRQVNEMTATLIHELAHQQARLIAGLYSGDDEWLFDLSAETRRVDAYVSDYARESAAEDLAETVTAASLANDGHTNHTHTVWTGDPAKDAVLQKKYDYLLRKGYIKAIPPK